jgi:GcrA cell cycle regulator
MKNRRVVDWTPELIERLRHLWREGVPAAKIARLFDNGATKNSIIGKAHRLKLALRHMPPGTHLRGVRHSTKPRKARPSRAKAPLEASLPHPVPEPPPPLPRPPPPPKPRLKPGTFTLLDLRPHECRWPTNSPERGGLYLFCGFPAEEGSYCREHAGVGFSGKGTARQKVTAGWQPRQAGF